MTWIFARGLVLCFVVIWISGKNMNIHYIYSDLHKLLVFCKMFPKFQVFSKPCSSDIGQYLIHPDIWFRYIINYRNTIVNGKIIGGCIPIYFFSSKLLLLTKKQHQYSLKSEMPSKLYLLQNGECIDLFSKLWKFGFPLDAGYQKYLWKFWNWFLRFQCNFSWW